MANIGLIPLLPLAAAVILIFFGRRLGKAAPLVSLSALLGSVLLSLKQLKWIVVELPQANVIGEVYGHVSWTWFSHAGKPLTLGLKADPLSVVMLLVVTIIGWFIMLYSTGYMAGDKRYS